MSLDIIYMRSYTHCFGSSRSFSFETHLERVWPFSKESLHFYASLVKAPPSCMTPQSHIP